MRRLRSIFGGLSDSAFAALATFAVGLTAIRTLPDAGVALFSLMLTGYIIGMILPRNTVLTHIELQANTSEDVFVPLLRDSLRRAALPLLFAFGLALCAGVPVWTHVTPAQYLCMGLGAGLATATGAVLAHVRATMHIVRLHEWAGAASMINFAVTLVLIVVGQHLLFGTARWALPFGAMVGGQAVALLLWRGVVARIPARRVGELTALSSRLLYLVPVGSAQLAIYIQSTLVVRLLGPTASAELESARVAASPVYILASGLGALLVPPLVRQLARHSTRETMVGLVRGMLVVTGAGLAYAVTLTGVGPVISAVLGRHVDPLLAGARAFAFSIEGPTSLNLGILIALNEFLRPAWLSVLGAVASVGITTVSLHHWGLYSVPAGQLASAVIQVGMGLCITSWALKRRGSPAVSPTSP